MKKLLLALLVLGVVVTGTAFLFEAEIRDFILDKQAEERVSKCFPVVNPKSKEMVGVVKFKSYEPKDNNFVVSVILDLGFAVVQIEEKVSRDLVNVSFDSEELGSNMECPKGL